MGLEPTTTASKVFSVPLLENDPANPPPHPALVVTITSSQLKARWDIGDTLSSVLTSSVNIGEREEQRGISVMIRSISNKVETLWRGYYIFKRKEAFRVF